MRAWMFWVAVGVCACGTDDDAQGDSDATEGAADGATGGAEETDGAMPGATGMGQADSSTAGVPDPTPDTDGPGNDGCGDGTGGCPGDDSSLGSSDDSNDDEDPLEDMQCLEECEFLDLCVDPLPCEARCGALEQGPFNGELHALNCNNIGSCWVPEACDEACEVIDGIATCVPGGGTGDSGTG